MSLYCYNHRSLVAEYILLSMDVCKVGLHNCTCSRPVLVDEVHCVKMWHVLLYTVKFHCYQNALVMMSLRMISEW